MNCSIRVPRGGWGRGREEGLAVAQLFMHRFKFPRFTAIILTASPLNHHIPVKRSKYLVLILRIRARTNTSLNGTCNDGRPLTPVTIKQPRYTTVYIGHFSYRLPTMHRLDAGVCLQWKNIKNRTNRMQTQPPVNKTIPRPPLPHGVAVPRAEGEEADGSEGLAAPYQPARRLPPRPSASA